MYSFGLAYCDVVLLILIIPVCIPVPTQVSHHTYVNVYVYGEKAVYTLAISVPVTSGT